MKFLKNQNKNKMENNFLNWITEGRFLYKQVKKPTAVAPQESQEPGKEKTPEELAKEAAEKAKIEAKKKAKKSTVKDLSGEKREDIKKELKEPENEPAYVTAPKLKSEEFLKHAEDTSEEGEKNKLDLLKINPLRENTHIDAKQWDVTNVDGLNKVYGECEDLGIVSQSPDFYNTLFATLRSGIDKTKNPTYWSQDDTRIMFQDPASHLKEIEALPAQDNFLEGGEQFVKAWEHFEWLRGEIMVAKDCQELEILAKQEGLDSDPVATKVADFARSTLSSVQKAVNEKDYATLGMYGVGAYAFYKVYQKFFGGGHEAGGEHGKGFDWKKLLLYGTAGYAGYHFAKKAGYDPLKWFGLKAENYEIKGTPMENMSTILRSCPGLKEDDKKIDADIVLRVATVNLVTLHELRKQANSNGIHHIDPREFPDIFPDLADVPPFKMGRGEEEGDYTGMSTTKLDTKQREYIRVSQQLYKIAFAAEKVYDATLKKYHFAYKGISYEDALKNDGDRKLAKFWHLFSAVEKYAVKEPGTMFDREKLDSVRSQVVDLFKEHAENTSVDVESHIDGNHFQGKINDFPVVFIIDKDKVKVYLRNNYGKGYQRIPGADASAEIPLKEGNPKAEVEKAVSAVTKRMGKLIGRLQKKGGKTFTDIGFIGKKWQCKIAMPKEVKENFDVVEDETTGFFNIYPDGEGVILVDEAGGVKLDSNEAILKQNPAAFSILSRFINQPKFTIFAPLYRLNRLNFVDEDTSDSKFIIKIGKKGIPIEIKYDNKSKSFSFAKPKQEQELLKPGSGFTDELKDALREDDRVKHILKSWRDIVSELDEDYLFHFFKSVPDWFTHATSDYWARGIRLKDFTGSIAKNYTSGLLDAQINLVLAKVAVAVEKSGSLDKASDQVNEIFGRALADLTQQRDNLSGATTDKSDKGKKFSEDEFKEVITGVAAAGIKSNDYKTWYKQFVDYVFLKYGEDDLRKGRAIKSKDVISVFAYYTAVCDDPDMDGADLQGGALSGDAEEVRDYIKFHIEDGATPSDDEIIKFKGDFETKNKRAATDEEVEEWTSAYKKVHPDKPPTDQEIADYLLIDISKISAIKDEINTSEKSEKYRLYSGYVNYVVSKIQLKYTEGRLADTIPQPGGFWEIKMFDEWKHSPESVSAPEFIDTREPMKMSKDYIPLDKKFMDGYLKMNADDRAKVDKSRLILPRSYVGADGKTVYTINVDFGHYPLTNDEKALLREVLGSSIKEIKEGSFETNHKNFKKTGLEDAFTARMAEAFDKMERDYKPKGNDFKALRDRYLLRYSIDYNQKGLFTIKNNSSSFYPISKIERLLEGHGTITKAVQDREIDNEIARIVKTEILNDKNFDTYFNKQTLGKNISSTWDDFTSWLFD